MCLILHSRRSLAVCTDRFGHPRLLFRFSRFQPHTCEVTLRAMCSVSFGIYVSVLQALLPTDDPSAYQKTT